MPSRGSHDPANRSVNFLLELGDWWRESNPRHEQERIGLVLVWFRFWFCGKTVTYIRYSTYIGQEGSHFFVLFLFRSVGGYHATTAVPRQVALP